MKRILLVALLLLLGGNFCSALGTKFSKEHACVPAGEHISSCEILRGKDTLWRFALKSDSSIKTLMGLNPAIVNPNLIYAKSRINVPDNNSTETTLLVKTVSIHSELNEQEVPANVLAGITLDYSPALPMEVLAENSPVIGMLAPASVPSEPVAITPVPAKITGYRFMVSGSNLQGPLQTQLLLFDSEDEKRLMLPCGNCRIDLKPSWAVPAQDGDGMVYIHLKRLPAQPFLLLVGGINVPVDSTQIQPYSGKTPGVHPFLHTMASIGKIGAQGGISLAVTGNPFIALGVVGGPRLVKLFIEHHEKLASHKLAAAQAAVDKSKLALYRASLESNPLSKEIQ